MIEVYDNEMGIELVQGGYVNEEDSTTGSNLLLWW